MAKFMSSKRKIVFQLNEHDASLLLALVKQEILIEDKTWRPYWKRLEQNMEQSIEHAFRSDDFRYSSDLIER